MPKRKYSFDARVRWLSRRRVLLTGCSIYGIFEAMREDGLYPRFAQWVKYQASLEKVVAAVRKKGLENV